MRDRNVPSPFDFSSRSGSARAMPIGYVDHDNENNYQICLLPSRGASLSLFLNPSFSKLTLKTQLIDFLAS
jgi:hypothetical protein